MDSQTIYDFLTLRIVVIMINFREWYDQRKQTYTSLLGVVKPLLEILVSNKGISHLSIEGNTENYHSDV